MASISEKDSATESGVRARSGVLDVYQSILSAAMDGFWLLTTDGRFLGVNHEYCAISGYSEEEMLGLLVTQIEPLPVAEDAPHVLRVGDGSDVRYETRHRRKDGSWSEVEVSARFHGSNGGIIMAFVRDITEMRESQRKLAESEARIASIANNIHSGMIYQAMAMPDGSRKMTYLGDAVRRLYGISPEQGMADASLIYSRIHPDDVAQVAQEEEEAIRTLTVFRAEARVYNPDGTLRWTSWVSCPRRLQDGTICWDGIEFDVTERRRVEEELRQSQSLVKAVLDHLSIGIAVNTVEPNVRFAYMNDNFPRFYRTTREALSTPDAFWEAAYQDPVLREKIRQRVLEDCATGLPERMIWSDVPITREGEPTTYVNARNIPIPDMPLMISTVEDVTERKLLLESMRQFKTIFDSASSGAAVTDLEGRLIYVNDAMASAHGYAVEELVGQNLRIFHSQEQMPQVESLLATMRQGGHFAATEVWHRRKDGTLFPMLMVGTVVNDEAGRPRWFTATALDISKQKTLETQLQQAQKMESVGRLAGGVAHDFNNMLSVIIGQAEMGLVVAGPEDPIRENLQEILSAAERSAGLTRQLLAFARQQTATPRTLQVNATIEGMLSILRRLIGENIDLVWRPGSQLGHVLMDPAQVDQVLANLCVNARDAITGHGRIVIESGVSSFDDEWCQMHPEFSPGRYVWLAVSDDGCGMDAATLQNVFDPFFTTKGVGEGTGLGLATVYGIVKQNRGFIRVYSEKGHGSTFRVYLPEVGEAHSHDVEDEVGPAYYQGTETILLVEDEPAILQMARTMLENQGYKLLATGSPTEAVRLASQHTGPIHLLISDVVMPEMNGWQLAGAIQEVHPEIKRLFMSGYTANVIASHGVVDGTVHFIQKPFYARELAAKVRKVLG